jgi:hypothetical protein
LLVAVVVLLLGAATGAKAATFTEVGTQLNLDLNTANEAVAIAATASTYTLTLTGGAWSGVDSANVTGNGTATLTVTASGLAAFDSVNLTDSATGTAATFNNSGLNTYSDNFDITLDNAAGAITFNGNSVFVGTAGIAARTNRNISFNAGSTLSTSNGNIILEANQQATATTGDFIGVNINGAAVIVTGSGTLSVAGRGGNGASLQHGVQVRSGGNLSGGLSGLLNVSGTGGASAAGSNNGVFVRDGSSQITSSGGPITITGQGGGTGASGNNTGVALTLSGQIIGPASPGTVTVTGTGGAASGLFNMGVGLGAAGRITSNGGNVSVTGFGGGLGGGTEHFGVWLTQGAEITAGGLGTVTVEGTGGTDGSINYGVFVREANSRITSNGGSVSVTGQGGGVGAASDNIGVYLLSSGQIGAGGAGTTTVLGTGGATTGTDNRGVSIFNAAQIFSTGGAISVTGVGTATSHALWVDVTGVIASGNNAAITLTADSVALGGFVNAGTGTATIQPRTAGTLINLGDAADILNSSPLTLGLSDGELDRVTAGTLVLGNATSGALTLSADISRPASTDVQLLAGATIQSSPGISGAFHTGGGSLLIAPGAGGYFRPWRNGTDVTASLLSFNSGSDLFINLSGTVVDTFYAQLNVAGAVDLSGVDLLLPPSSFFPAAGDVFTIVSANSVSGTFNGLADGSTLVFNGRTLQIDYSATTVTLTDITTAVTSFTGPTATGTGNATATLTGGGSACGFAPTPQFVAVASVPAPPPAGYTFPHGLFSFTLVNCTPGGTVTFTVTYPNPSLPPGTQYWKFGPTAGDPSNHWYVLPATLAGNTATFTITDGGLGDDDLVADGDIVDQGGPGAPSFLDTAAGIPTLGEWALLLFSALLGGLLWRARRRVG